MAPSSPTVTTPKLRRSSTALCSDQDVEKGESTRTLEQPLLNHPTTTPSSGSTSSKPSKKVLTILFCFVAVSIILGAIPCYWIFLYVVGPYIPDDSCPIKEWQYPDCHEHLMHKQGANIPPLITQEEWIELRRKYQQSVQVSSLADGWDQIPKDNEGKVVPNTGFRLPVDFKYSPGKGRGIYATSKIPKGAQIWDSRFRGIFDSECSAKMYFAQLTQDEQCKAVFWGYGNNFLGKGFQYMTDLDGHGYLNDCPAGSKSQNAVHHFEGELHTTNYRLPQFLTVPLGRGSVDDATLRRRNQPGAHGLYASRDILPGEEICFDYTEIQMNGIFDYYSMLFVHSLQIHQWLTK